MENNFLKSAKIALVLVYLVIVAGALVRMTGSGMGCPDWPKCFGYYIPPTEKATLLWQPNRDFKKGQVIIVDEKLFVAKSDFKSNNAYDSQQFEAFTKHDYAEFNVQKTWIEYLNRLVGALAGLACFVMAILSIWLWKKNKKITLLSWLVVILMGIQGWLGAKVVYSVLNPIKITIHMVVALLIVATILYIINLIKPFEKIKTQNKAFKKVLYFALFLTIIQIIMGTQVRQFIDEQVKNGIGNEHLWLRNPELSFYFHRSFSILILVSNLFLFLKNKKLELGLKKINWVLLILFIEIFSGIAMYYFYFPFGSQAIHLVLASLLFGFQFFMILEINKKISS